jgi:hypothetical protein
VSSSTTKRKWLQHTATTCGREDSEDIKTVLSPKDALNVQEFLLRAHDAYEDLGQAFTACRPSSTRLARFDSEFQVNLRASMRVQTLLRTIIKNMYGFYSIVTQAKYSTLLTFELEFSQGSRPLQQKWQTAEAALKYLAIRDGDWFWPSQRFEICGSGLFEKKFPLDKFYKYAGAKANTRELLLDGVCDVLFFAGVYVLVSTRILS